MKNQSMWARIMVALAVTAFVGLGVSRSQETAPKSDELALAVGDAQKGNLAALSKYSWRVKSNVAKAGQSMATTVTEMRFNTEGKLDATKISSESNVEKKPGLRGRQQEKEMEEFSTYLEGVMNQSFKYIFMSKGTLVDVFDGAKIAESSESVDVTAGDVFVKGDQLVLSIDPTSKLARKLTFKTTLDKDTITGAVDFATIANGPNKPTHLVIQVPTQTIVITSETYDWLEQK